MHLGSAGFCGSGSEWLIKLQSFLSSLCVSDKYVHVYVCVHEWLLGHVCHDMCVDLRGWSLPFTLFKTGPHLSAWMLQVFWVLNSSSHACWQALLIHSTSNAVGVLTWVTSQCLGPQPDPLLQWLLAFMAWLLGSSEDYDLRWKEGNYKD